MPVDPATQARLQGSAVEARVVQQFGGPALKRNRRDLLVTASHCERCVFLTSDDRCGIHAEMGASAKPFGCRQFPFLTTLTPDGVTVGVSFYCPSVARNLGSELASYRDELEELLGQAGPVDVVGRWLELAPGVPVEWQVYRMLEDHMDDELPSDPVRVPGRILWRLCCHVATASAPLDEQTMARLVAEAAEIDLNAHPLLVWMEAYFTKSLLGRLEAESPTEAPELIIALRQDLPAAFRSAGWTGRMSQVQAYAASCPQTREWLLPEVIRYQRALLFRKFLATRRPVLENLAVFYLLPLVLDFYTYLYALAREADAPQPEDYYRALERSEGELITHGHEAFALSESFLDCYLQQARRSQDDSAQQQRGDSTQE